MGAHQPHGPHSTHNPQPGQDHGVPKKKRKKTAHPSKKGGNALRGRAHPSKRRRQCTLGVGLGGKHTPPREEAMHLGGEHTPPREGGNALHCSTVHVRAHLRQSSPSASSPPPTQVLHAALHRPALCALSLLSTQCPQASGSSPEPQRTGTPARRECFGHLQTF
jgi:hypothetical protein